MVSCRLIACGMLALALCVRPSSHRGATTCRFAAMGHRLLQVWLCIRASAPRVARFRGAVVTRSCSLVGPRGQACRGKGRLSIAPCHRVVGHYRQAGPRPSCAGPGHARSSPTEGDFEFGTPQIFGRETVQQNDVSVDDNQPRIVKSCERRFPHSTFFENRCFTLAAGEPWVGVMPAGGKWPFGPTKNT